MAEKMRIKNKDRLLQPRVKDRRQSPKIGNYKGKQVILCPFCDPPHAITTNVPAHCGTILEVTARQLIFKNVECALCGGKDGELTQIGPELFQHIRNCSPGRKIYISPPKPSLLAKIIFKFPKGTHLLVARLFGKVSVELQDSQGKSIGKYIWENIR